MASAVTYHHPPFSPPTPIPLERNRSIRFLHPAYSPLDNILFWLPRVDPADAGGQPQGIHHRTALLMCQIVANNAFDSGNLFYDREGRRPVVDVVGLDESLTEQEYYFIVGGNAANRYPVVPSFREWQFPHRSLPDTWEPSMWSPSTQNPLQHTDELPRCALTDHACGLKIAHVVPREEAAWFVRNHMHLYGDTTLDVDDSSNLVRLRADIHRCFDARLFLIAPKPQVAAPAAAYVVHVVKSGHEAGEFCALYQNAPLKHLQSVSPEYLFARFAWTVLLLVKPFILTGIKRKVVRLQQNPDGSYQYMVNDLSGLELSNLYGGGGTRSASVKKWRRAAEQQEGDDYDKSGVQETVDPEDVGFIGADEWNAAVFGDSGEGERGRSRKRAQSSSSVDSSTQSAHEVLTPLPPLAPQLYSSDYNQVKDGNTEAEPGGGLAIDAS